MSAADTPGVTIPEGCRILLMGKRLAAASVPEQEPLLLQRVHDDGTRGAYVMLLRAGDELEGFDALVPQELAGERDELLKAL